MALPDDTHVPKRTHVRRVQGRIERLRALNVEERFMQGQRPDKRTLNEWITLRKQIDGDVDRILAGLVGEWEPEVPDYEDEDDAGAFLQETGDEDGL